MMNRIITPRYCAACLVVIMAVLHAFVGFADSGESRHSPGQVTVIRQSLPDSIENYRHSLPQQRPPLRGFRAPILDNAETPWPFYTPSERYPELVRDAAAIVGTRLATDGLLLTTAQVIERIGPDQFISKDAATDWLKLAGIPVDLLEYFTLGDDNDSNAAHGIASFIAMRLLQGETALSLKPLLEQARFQFRPTHAGFRVATESGEHDIGMLRLQVSRGDYWDGPGDGGNLDLVQQLLETVPEAQTIITVESIHADALVNHLSQWTTNRRAPVTVLVEDFPVAQWAQDNGKAGIIINNDAANDEPIKRIATLTPRYASRGEDGSTFVPGDTFLLDGLAKADHLVIQSPLLFQGGNLLAVQDPATGKRLLLVGEAEVYRNIALGLTEAQVLDAFRIEFGVDRCEILPAVSFHIDYDVCVRAHEGQQIAFVNDTQAAVRLILKRGVDVLAFNNMIDAADAAAAHRYIDSQQWRAFMDFIGNAVLAEGGPEGHFPLSLAEVFSTGATDPGVGNFERFLLAIDYAIAWGLPPESWPQHRHAQSYLRSLLQREKDREQLHQQIADLGFKVVPVPSLASAERSVCAINGIHARNLYLMPVYGGLMSPVDNAAMAVFREALGDDVRIVPVRTGESQRRVGAVHCSAAAYPKTQE